MGGKTALYAGDVPCPIVGRISMDLIGVDVTSLTQPVESLVLLNDRQTIYVLAEHD